MKKSSLSVEHNPFAILAKLDSDNQVFCSKAKSIKPTIVAQPPVKTVQKSTDELMWTKVTHTSTKKTSISKFERTFIIFHFNGNDYKLPANWKKSVLYIKNSQDTEISFCASQLSHMYRKVYSDYTTTGTTRCTHHFNQNHHNICWKSIHGTPCSCKKVHINLTDYMIPKVCPIINHSVMPKLTSTSSPTSQSLLTSQKKCIVQSFTFGELLMDGNWKDFLSKCIRESSYSNAKFKTLMCQHIVCFESCNSLRCAFAHNEREQAISLPTRLVHLFAKCDKENQQKILQPIRKEIERVIVTNSEKVMELRADQAKQTEYNQFIEPKNLSELKVIKADIKKKVENSKFLHLKGKFIPDVSIWKIRDISITKLLELWWALACNSHETFALFGRSQKSKTFLIEDFVWELARLCAITPCFTWRYYNEKYIEPLQQSESLKESETSDEWTTIKKQKPKEKIIVEAKDICCGGQNCNKGRHSYDPFIDLDEIFNVTNLITKEQQTSFTTTIDDFVNLNNVVQPLPEKSKLKDWAKLAAKPISQDTIINKIATKMTHSIIFSGISQCIKDKQLAEEKTPVEHMSISKPKKKKKIQECEFNDPIFDGTIVTNSCDCYLPSEKKKSKSNQSLPLTHLFTSETPKQKKRKTKRDKKKLHVNVNINDTLDSIYQEFTHPEQELDDILSYCGSRFKITRKKRARGEQLIISNEDKSLICQLKTELKIIKFCFTSKQKGNTLIISVNSADTFIEIFSSLSKVFHKMNITISTIQRIDEKGLDFNDIYFDEIIEEEITPVKSIVKEETESTSYWIDDSSINNPMDEVVTSLDWISNI